MRRHIGEAAYRCYEWSTIEALLATAKAEGRQAVWNTVLEVYSEKSDPWPTLEKLAAEELNHE